MQQADNQPSLLFIPRTLSVQATLRSDILCCFSHLKRRSQGLGSLAQDISIVRMFSCYGNRKACATVTDAALTTALLASFYLDLIFVDACISIHRIFLHGNPKCITEPIHQTSSAVKPGFKYPALLKYQEYSGFFPYLS